MLKRLAIILLLSLASVLLTNEYVSAKNSSPAGFSIDDTDVHITMPACNKLTGSVIGLKIINPDGKQFTYSWKDAEGTEVGTQLDLKNKSDGVYKLTVSATDGSGTQTYGPVNFISTQGTVINAANAHIAPSNCGQATGGVTGITATGLGTLSYSWVDVHGQEVGTHADISGLPVGVYSLIVVSEDRYCGAVYGPIVIPNAGGPVIDDSKMKYFKADCQNRGGSLTGIKVTGGTGNYRYEWYNAADVKISDQLDLVNRGVGYYRLVVYDEGSCGPSVSIPYNLVSNAGGYEYSVNSISPTTCDELGSVKLTYDGAFIFKWLDDENHIVSTTNELLNARGGMYKLIISGNCTDPSQNQVGTIFFNLGPKRVILPEFPASIKGTCINSNTGSIKVTGNDQIVGYKWLDANNQQLGTGNEIKNLPGGNYSLYLIDTMGCDKLYKTYTVPSSTGAQLSAGTVSNDECNTSIGTVTGIQITGGIAPYTYNWTKADGSTAGDKPDLTNAAAGEYTLHVMDASGCDPAELSFTVANSDLLETPILKNKINLCYPTQISLKVENVKPKSTYRLYDSNTATIPIDEQATGVFSILPAESKIYYVSRQAGVCESEKAAVTVNVALSSFEIANTFSPNNDGINDTWILKGLKNNSTAAIKVFNRNGQMVFQSTGYAVPFDGTRNGKLLPIGVYYYIIDLKNCDVISGSLTILR